MNVVSGGPGKPKQSDGDKNRPDNRHGQTGLSGCHPIVFVRNFHVSPRVGQRIKHSKYHPHSYAQKCQTTRAGIPALVLLKHDGKCREHHIESSVDYSHIDGRQKHDRFPKEENPWPRKSDLELLGHGTVLLSGVQFGNVDFACNFGELGGAPPQKNGYICFWHEDGTDNPQGTSEYGHQAYENESQYMPEKRNGSCET